ncbi:uncharacterized protein LOC141642299 [Silene latifolia]|uniref:uncharacterized protein LOC141642299 n=1 Tax=Silene latifolia TaxID=37657 RepID=UPI003D7887F4
MPEDSLYSLLDDPHFLSQTDQPSLQLSSFQFDGTNFLQWRQEIIRALLSKNKVGFITGDCSCPPPADKKHNSWIRCDILYNVSAKTLWADINERYGQLNVLDLYALKKELSNFSQDTRSLLDYYGKIKNLCLEVWANSTLVP